MLTMASSTENKITVAGKVEIDNEAQEMFAIEPRRLNRRGDYSINLPLFLSLLGQHQSQ